MARNFTNEELMDMILTFGEARQNSVAATRLYAQKFPQRYHPGRECFLRLLQRGRESGHLQPNYGQHGRRVRPRHILNLEEEIMNIVEEQPIISTPTIAAQLGVSQSTVWRILITKAGVALPLSLPTCTSSTSKGFSSSNSVLRVAVTSASVKSKLYRKYISYR